MALNVAVMAAIVTLLGGGILLLLQHVLMGQVTASAQADARRAAAEMREGDTAQFRSDHLSSAAGTFYVAWSASGDVQFNPSGAPAAQLSGPARVALAGRPATQVLDLAGDRDVLVASEPVYRHGVLIGVVQAGQSLAPVHAVEEQAIGVVAAASAAALALSLLGAWFLAGRALVPIRQALDRQREFTADASHELRTPLAMIDAGVQLLLRHPDQTVAENDELLSAMRQETRRMTRLVSGLLALARADAGVAEVQLADVDVDELVSGAVRDLNVVDGGVPIRLVRASAGRARVDPDRFKQLLLVLIDNARRHSPPDAAVEVTCSGDGGILLEVADRGPGIPPALRRRVFDRFYRADASRAGPEAGLGLPIARWIVAAHGGTIGLLDNRPGLRVRVAIPGAPAARTDGHGATRAGAAADGSHSASKPEVQLARRSGKIT
jgi:signal transduction histidine kinase